jgi:rod shape-determining protein MreD
MIKGLPKDILLFIILVLAQVFVFNNIQINGYINPNIYILFILLLPFTTNGWVLLLSAFFLGLSVDLFSQTLGMHAFATVMMAGARPLALSIMSPREGYTANTSPSIADYGFGWFLRYTLFLVLIHHLTLFYIEVFSFQGFFRTLLRVILSVTFTVILVILEQYLFERK